MYWSGKAFLPSRSVFNIARHLHQENSPAEAGLSTFLRARLSAQAYRPCSRGSVPPPLLGFAEGFGLAAGLA